MVIFNALRRSDIEEIVVLQLAAVAKKLAERNIKIVIDEKARQYVVEHGFDPEYGARPIKRLIQKAILDKLADSLIAGNIKDGDKVRVGFENTTITVSV